MGELALREAIDTLEECLSLSPKYDYKPIESLCNGVYIREAHLPKNLLLTTDIHLTEHFFTIMEGSCVVYTENGSEELKAPFKGITKPGTKRVIYVLEDMVWITYHTTDKDNIDQAKKGLVAKTYEEAQKCLS